MAKSDLLSVDPRRVTWTLLRTIGDYRAIHNPLAGCGGFPACGPESQAKASAPCPQLSAFRLLSPDSCLLAYRLQCVFLPYPARLPEFAPVR